MRSRNCHDQVSHKVEGKVQSHLEVNELSVGVDEVWRIFLFAFGLGIRSVGCPHLVASRKICESAVETDIPGYQL